MEVNADEFEVDYETDSSSEHDTSSLTEGDRLLHDVEFDELRARAVPFPTNMETISSPSSQEEAQPTVSFDCDALEVLVFAPSMAEVLKTGSFTLYGAPKR